MELLYNLLVLKGLGIKKDTLKRVSIAWVVAKTGLEPVTFGL